MRASKLIVVVAALTAMFLAVTPAAGKDPGTPAPNHAAIVETANDLLARLSPMTPEIERESRALRQLLDSPAGRNSPPGHAVAILNQMNRLGDLVAKTAPGLEEFGIRTEAEFGTPLCHEDGIAEEASYCSNDEWLSTRSPNFVNIRGEVYWRGSNATPHGRQMTASFVAAHDRTSVAITFAAEAHVVDDLEGTDRRMFLQAVVDGEPISPTDVVFAVGLNRGARSFVFTTEVDAGIHTVEMRWKMDERSTGYLRDATLLVRMGAGVPSNLGALVLRTPPSGPNLETSSDTWSDIPGMSAYAWVGSSEILTATMSAESVVYSDKRILLRALVDGTPMQPSNVVFGKGGQIQSRTMTFGETGLKPGWHFVQMQWMTEAGGTAYLGDRTLALASYPNSDEQPTHPFVAAPSGPNVYTQTDGLEPMAHMHTRVWVPEKGNGEVAVQLSAEAGVVSGDGVYAVLAVDGTLLLDQIVELTDGATGAQTRHWVFEAKKLSPGLHDLEIWFGPGAGGQAYVGDRTLAVLSEVGFIPDLAEAPQFGAGHVNWSGDLIAPVEPLIGTRKVLAILIDPGFCGDLGSVIIGPAPAPDPDCQSQETVPAARVESALFGLGGDGGGLADFEENNVASYLSAQSNGRFTIVKAGPGVAGWYNTTFGQDMYYDHSGECTFGFDDGGSMLIADAVAQSDGDVNYASFDMDADGVLTPEELAIIIVIPRPDGDGSARAQLYSQTCPSSEPMSLDGVELPRYLAKWNTSLNEDLEAFQFTTGAHELMHVLRQLDDLYMPNLDWATEAQKLSMMADNRTSTTHLDPWHKLMLGWVTPVLVERDGVISITNVAESDTVYVVPRYHKPGGGEEFFIIENRQEDQGYPNFDDGILDSGIGIWHVINDLAGITTAPIGEQQAFWDTLNVDPGRPGSTGQMGRKGLRLIRPFDDIVDGKAVFNDAEDTLWSINDYTLESGSCFLVVPTGDPFHNKLAWGDCTASGITLEFLDWVADSMNVSVTID